MVFKEGYTEYEIIKFIDDRIQKNGKPVKQALLKRFEADISSCWFGYIHQIECGLGKYESMKTIHVSNFTDDNHFYKSCKAAKELKELVGNRINIVN